MYGFMYIYGLRVDREGWWFAKNSIPYSQALRLKAICSTSTEFDKNCAIIKQKFLDRQYKE